MSAAAVGRNPHRPGSRRAVAWDKGWRAFKAGLPFATNPYGHVPGQHYMRVEWSEGWLRARESERS